MRIEFRITEMPKAGQKKYFIAYLSGELIIIFDDVVFFKEPDILLAEFAVCILKWLKKANSGNYENFVYETMDHGEPIIQMIYAPNNGFHVDSIWENKTINNLHKAEEVVSGFEKFIENFEKELLVKYNINLSDFID
jgi:hypothetical protein